LKSCKALAEFSKYSTGEIYALIFKSGVEQSFDEGKIEPKEFYELVKKRIEANGISYAQFLGIWGDIFTPTKGITSVLKRIKKDIDRLILSNTNKIHWQYIEELSLVQEYFSDSKSLILSFKLGVTKPDRKLYNYAIQRAGVRPSEIIYIDDKKRYVNDFVRCGAKGINFDCQKHSIEILENALYQNGALD